VSGNRKPGAWPDGLVIVDKPGGMTSHDVVARVRRLARTRRVGHAGTLDPMATGVLVIGIEKATRLLGHLTLTEKTYEATIRLGLSTTTDDAEGEALPARGSDPPLRSPGGMPPPDPSKAPDGAPDERKGSVSSARITRACDVSRETLDTEIAKLTGEILQVPSSVSAIKVNGQRAYKLTRAGEAPELAARPVTIHEFRVTAIRQVGDFLDLDATIRCSSGTYIRALARDLGTALGTGGHLTALRRTAVGPYTLAQAHTLKTLEAQNQEQNNSPERVRLTPDAQQELAAPPASHRAALHPPGSLAPSSASIEAIGAAEPPAVPPVIPLAEAAAAAFPRLDLTDDEARRLAQGARLPVRAPLPGGSPPAGSPPAASRPPGSLAPSSASIEANGTEEQVNERDPIAAFAPDGTLVALVTVDGGQIRSLAVFADLTPAPPRDLGPLRLKNLLQYPFDPG
jgi:tRNA pseudouridine55 synthase